MKDNILALFFVVALLVSCKTNDRTSQLNYMQNVDQIATDAAIQNANSTIQSGDELAITIMAKDMNVVKPFNQNYYSIPNLPAAQVADRSSTPVYIVDSNGNIDFPVIGLINTKGYTSQGLQDVIKEEVKKHIKNPGVTVKILNYKITILGEVTRPGQYSMSEGQANVLSALGLAGDVTVYAKRNDILLVRTENNQVVKERINLMDANFLNSPFFKLKQNDVLYISANETKDKLARQDPNTNIYIAVAGMVIGLAGIFITIFKN